MVETLMEPSVSGGRRALGQRYELLCRIAAGICALSDLVSLRESARTTQLVNPGPNPKHSVTVSFGADSACGDRPECEKLQNGTRLGQNRPRCPLHASHRFGGLVSLQRRAEISGRSLPELNPVRSSSSVARRRDPRARIPHLRYQPSPVEPSKKSYRNQRRTAFDRYQPLLADSPPPDWQNQPSAHHGRPMKPRSPIPADGLRAVRHLRTSLYTAMRYNLE
jgi:hypothetical protein